MNKEWSNRNPIVRNLLNPAFCGEILRVTAKEYAKNTDRNFPYLYSFLVLPIILHEETRKRLPRTTRTYIFAWVEDNQDLFIEFPYRAKNMVKYTKEAIMFLLMYKAINVDENGDIQVTKYQKKNYAGEEYEEYLEIMNKAKMLGGLATKNGTNS